MYTAFLSVAMACGTPGLMAALALGALAWRARELGLGRPRHETTAAPDACPDRCRALGGSSPCACPPCRAGQLSNVMGCLTTYGIGSAPPFYGTGYVPQARGQHGLP